MDSETAYQMGRSWASQIEKFQLYDEMAAFHAFSDAIGGEYAGEFWGAWEEGVESVPKIIAGDAPLGVRRIAELTGFNRSYIKAEIKAGRLISRLVPASIGKPYHEIQPQDFIVWANNPKRGSRTKKDTD
jgi:hypothetical protein